MKANYKLANKIKVFLLLPAFLFGFEKEEIVVNFIQLASMSVGSSTVDPSLINGIIEKELAKTNKFKVLERSDVLNSSHLVQEALATGYSAYDASNLGNQLDIQLIVLGRFRNFGDDIWIQIGLFDVAIQEKIKEVSEYYSSSREDLITEAIPKLAQKLAGTYKELKIIEKPALSTVYKQKASSWKWVAIGVLTTSIAYLIGMNTNSEPAVDPVNPNTKVSLTW